MTKILFYFQVKLQYSFNGVLVLSKENKLYSSYSVQLGVICILLGGNNSYTHTVFPSAPLLGYSTLMRRMDHDLCSLDTSFLLFWPSASADLTGKIFLDSGGILALREETFSILGTCHFSGVLLYCHWDVAKLLQGALQISKSCFPDICIYSQKVSLKMQKGEKYNRPSPFQPLERALKANSSPRHWNRAGLQPSNDCCFGKCGFRTQGAIGWFGCWAFYAGFFIFCCGCYEQPRVRAEKMGSSVSSLNK